MHSYWEWLTFPRLPNLLVVVTHQIGRLETSEQDKRRLNQRSGESGVTDA
jgi:hypothetical protein